MLKKIDISKIGKIVDSREMKGSLAIPSAVNGYSLCIEYAKNWIYGKISRDFFNGVYIDGRYVLEEFKRYTDIESQMSRKNPNLAILPVLDANYNRDFIDSTPNMTGIDNYIKRSRFEQPFFEDYSRCTKIQMSMKAIQVAFTFRIRVNTRAEQLDLRDYMNIAYKVGATMGDYIDQDYHIPYDLMLNLATDSGFKVKDRCIVDILEFMNYLNSNSKLPITYKFRGINGKHEFFVRQRQQYVHTRINDLDVDTGERKNHLDANFNIEMTTLVTYPVPQYYMYYSEISHNNIPNGIDPEEAQRIGIYAINLTDIPEINDVGWMLYMTTDVMETDRSKPLHIDDLLELFATSNSEESDIQRIIKWNNSMSINSDIFLDIKLFNNTKEIECHIDWTNGKLDTTVILEHEVSSMAIYINKAYLNDQLISQDAYNKTRVI